MNNNAPTTIALTLVLAAVGLKATDLAKYISVWCVPEKEDRAKAVNGIFTLAVTAFLGVIIVFVLKGSTWSGQILVGNTPVSDLSVGATILFGVAFSAVASTLYDFKKAVDTQDSAKKPKLLPQARDGDSELSEGVAGATAGAARASNADAGGGRGLGSGANSANRADSTHVDEAATPAGNAGC